MKALEKFRNKKVFIAYLVGVLLLSTSVSFAYFTSKTNTSGEGSIVVGTTTVLETDGINAEGTIEFNNVDMYPGHTGIAGIRVTATGTTPMIYNVVFNGTNTFNTPLNYTVYKTTTEVDVSYTCNQREDRIGVNTYYYEECTGTNIDQLGEVVATGTIHTSEGKTTLLDSEIILGKEEGNIVYYYVVIEYPNLDASQNDDLGSTISGNITIEEGGEYTNPSISMTGTTTSGNNGWVKSASINTTITTQTGVYEALYCTTTSNSCTPNTSATISDNSFSVLLSSNTSSQRVCVRVTDEYNQITSGCSEAYLVDTTNPTVSITSTSSTQNSISVTVRGSDSHSGIYQYRFSSNGGSSYTTVTSSSSTYTYTFNNLSAGTTYNIRVQSVDRSGRTSSTASRSVATETPNAGETILANYPTRLTRSDFSTTVTDTTTGTIYYADTSDGRTYYFAGNPTDNWVKFAGFWWRIIRINEDGSIRMIYAGEVSGDTDPVTTGTSTQIGTSAFNRLYNDNMYVGYMYTPNQAHGLGSDSTIKGIVDQWYEENLRLNYANYLSTEAGFCGDRTSATTNGGKPNDTGGTGATETYYGVNYRLLTIHTPTFECPDEANDLYTVASASKGNNALDYPIGLITADEVAFAGGTRGGTNKEYYLYTEEYYWTMTPFFFSDSAFVTDISGPEGTIFRGSGNVSNAYGVRPVINLSPNDTISGSGTTSDPYTVVGAP